jgi:arylformamidase
LLAVGENETDEFKRQSAAFAEAIRRKGGRADIALFPGRNHFDLIFDLLDADTAFGAASLRHFAAASGGEK